MSQDERERITSHDRQTAVRVMAQSRYVRRWVLSEAKYLGIDIDSPTGKQFLKDQAEALAKRIIRQ